MMGYDVPIMKGMVKSIEDGKITFAMSCLLFAVSLGCVDITGSTSCDRSSVYVKMVQWPVIVLIIIGIIRSRGNALSLFVPPSTSPNYRDEIVDSSNNRHMFVGVNSISGISIPKMDANTPSPSPSPSSALLKSQQLSKDEVQGLHLYRKMFPSFTSRLGTYVQYSHMAKIGIITAILLILSNSLICI